MLGKLSDKVHDQALSMSDINLRMDHIEKDLELLKNPNYDQLFGYIDRQVDNAVTDFNRKLELKADIRYVDTSLPERLENLYRNMNIKINEIQADIRKTATKEEFQELANTKVGNKAFYFISPSTTPFFDDDDGCHSLIFGSFNAGFISMWLFNVGISSTSFLFIVALCDSMVLHFCGALF